MAHPCSRLTLQEVIMLASRRPLRDDNPASTVVDALVAKGLIASQDADTAGSVVRGVLSSEVPERDRRMRGIMAEVAGYLGGVLVVAAVAVALATQWVELSTTARYWALAGCIAVLAVAGMAVMVVSGGRDAPPPSSTLGGA